MTTVKVGQKNRIAVPTEALRELGIRPGDRLLVEVSDGAIVLRPHTRNYADELREFAAPFWRGFDGIKYLNELRDEWSHRER